MTRKLTIMAAAFAALASVAQAAHAHLFRYMGRTGMVSFIVDDDVQLDTGVIKKALDRIGAQVKEPIEKLTAKQAGMAEQLLAIEQQMVKSRDHGPSNSGRADYSVFTKSATFEALRAKAVDKTERVMLDVSLKALVNGGGEADSNNHAFPTLADRISGVVGTVLKPLRLLDVMASVPTNSNAVEYARLKMIGAADVQVHEGDTKAQADFDGELIQSRISTIAVFVYVSTQALADSAFLEAEIDRIMRNSVQAKLEEQLVMGSGTAGRIEGLYIAAPEINTNLDPVAERIGDALTQMETEGRTPNVVLMNPADWFTISMLKDSTGRYIYGNPANPARPTLFNRPVVTIPSMPLHRALIGDTGQAPVFDRQQPTLAISLENRDLFERNMATLRVELRAGLGLYDALAFRRVSLDPRS